eukprot:1192526-Prorocentrum_minimum.AAC.5
MMVVREGYRARARFARDWKIGVIVPKTHRFYIYKSIPPTGTSQTCSGMWHVYSCDSSKSPAVPLLMRGAFRSDSPSHTCVWTAIQEGHRYNLSKLGCPRSKSPKIGSFPQRALRADQPLFAESVVPRAPNPEQQNPSRFCPSLRPYRLGLSRACSQR